MADIRKGCEVKIGKALSQPIGPGIGEECVVFRPAHTRWYRNRRKRVSRPSSWRCVQRVTLCNGRSHPRDCQVSGSCRRRHRERRHARLFDAPSVAGNDRYRLGRSRASPPQAPVPSPFGGRTGTKSRSAGRHAHARSNTRIDEIEEEKPHEAFGSLARQRLHNGAADIMTHDPDPADAKRIEQRSMSAAWSFGPKGPVGLSLSPKPRRWGATRV